MTKRFLALLLALIMCLSLAACGGDKDKEEEKDDEKVEQNESGSGDNNATEKPETEIDKRIKKIARKELIIDVNGSSTDTGLPKGQRFYDKDGVLLYEVDYLVNGRPYEWYEYNEYGNIVRCYKDLGEDAPAWELSYTCEYTYENDKLVKQEYVSASSGEAYQILSYDYNSEGKLVRYTMGTPSNPAYREVKYIYDSNGNCIKKEDHSGDYFTFNTYKYDENGNKTEFSMYDSNGKLKYTYEYDSNGNTILKYDAKDARSTTYEYDSNNRLVKVVNWNKGVTTATYDANGNCTYIEYGFNGEAKYTYSIEYDSNNNPTKWTMTKPDDTSDVYYNHTYVYEYDANGFRTKATKYDNNGNVLND